MKLDRPRPRPTKEVTWQALVGAFLVSAVISLAYPYIVLRIGLGPNVSVLAGLLGALFLLATARKTRGQNAIQNNIIQTAATSASSTAFMCVVAAAFGYLNMNESVDVKMTITAWQMFTWLSCSGTLGVLVASVFRRYFIDDKEMVFADGVAAAATISVLDDSGSEEASGKLRTLGLGALVGASVALLRDGLGLLRTLPIVMRFSIGLEWSALSLGTGLLLSLNVGLSMLLGTMIVAWVGPTVMETAGLSIVRESVAPEFVNRVMSILGAGNATPDQMVFLQQHGGMAPSYLAGRDFSILMLWMMWPATAFMITAALTSVLLQWRSIVAMFRSLLKSEGGGSNQDVSLRTVTWLGLSLTALLAYVQRAQFGMPVWQTVLAVFLGIPLILVGVRVLGETNQGPVSLMSNAMQVIFRIFSPSISMNLIAAGMAGDINAQGEGTTQCYRSGKILGSTPRILTWVSFFAIPIGAASVAIMYPLLVSRFGLGGDGLVAPTGLKLANMAVLMSKGVSAFPPGALLWTAIAAGAGILMTLGKMVWKIRWLPSAAALGFALILPGTLNVVIGLGAVLGWVWHRRSPATHQKYSVTVASGLIGGEALVAGLLLPILFYFGLIQ